MQHKIISFIFALIVLHAALPTHTSAQTLELINSPATEAANATDSASPTAEPTPPPPPEGLGFTISPSVLLINTDPGASQIYPLKIRNNSAQPEAIQISLKKVVANPTGGITFEDFDPEDKILDWIKFSQEKFIIAPDTWHQTDMTFSPGTDAKLGYYFAILFNRQSEIEAQDGQAQVTGAPAIIALADIASDQANPELQLIDFKTTKTWYDFLPVEFEITLKNTGNIHLRPFGNIFIDQDRKNDIGLLTINETAGFILPGVSRVFAVDWSDGFPLRVSDEDNPEESSVDWSLENASNFRIGKFKATALAAYDDGERDVPLESVIDFWVFPWQIVLVAVLVSLIVLIGLFAIFRLILKPFRRKRS